MSILFGNGALFRTW